MWEFENSDHLIGWCSNHEWSVIIHLNFVHLNLTTNSQNNHVYTYSVIRFRAVSNQYRCQQESRETPAIHSTIRIIFLHSNTKYKECLQHSYLYFQLIPKHTQWFKSDHNCWYTFTYIVSSRIWAKNLEMYIYKL